MKSQDPAWVRSTLHFLFFIFCSDFFHGGWRNSNLSGLLKHFPDSFVQPNHPFERKFYKDMRPCENLLLPHTLEFRSQISTGHVPLMRHISDRLIAFGSPIPQKQDKASPPMRIPDVLRLPVREQLTLGCERQSCSPRSQCWKSQWVIGGR